MKCKIVRDLNILRDDGNNIFFILRDYSPNSTVYFLNKAIILNRENNIICCQIGKKVKKFSELEKALKYQSDNFTLLTDNPYR